MYTHVDMLLQSLSYQIIPAILLQYSPLSLPLSPLSLSLSVHRLWERDNCQLAWTMNMVSVHTAFVDNFEETLINASDMSFMW